MAKDTNESAPAGQIDMAQARQFLREMASGKHLVSTIDAKGGPPDSRWLDPDDDAGWAEIESLNACGRNVYFTPNKVRADFSGSKPSKTDIEAVRFLYVDADPAATEGASHADAIEAVLEDRKAFERRFPPGAVVFSGNGLQFYWRADGLTVEEAENLGARLHAAANAHAGISAGGTHNADRIMRLPGTLNWPSRTKLRKGYAAEPSMAKVLMPPSEGSDRKLDLEKATALPLPERAPRAASERTAAGPEGYPDWPAAPADVALAALHEGWMDDARYRDTLDGSAHGGDRSASLMALARRARRHGLDVDRFASLVAHAGGAPLAHVEAQDLKARAVGRAYQNAAATSGVPDAYVLDRSINHDDGTVIDDGDSEPVSEMAVDDIPLPRGLVGDMARWGSMVSRRDTHIFSLAGALAGLSAASAGNYVLRTPDGLTPLGLLVMGVGETGAGKEMLTDVAEEAVREMRDVHLGPNSTFASAQALHQEMTFRRAQLWSDSEIGRYLKAVQSQDGGHQYQFVSTVMAAHTSALGTYNGTARAHRKDSRPPVPNPHLAAALASAPDPVRDSLNRETVQGGFMGRVLPFWTRRTPSRKPLGRADELAAAEDLRADLAEQLRALKCAHTELATAQQDEDQSEYEKLPTGRLVRVIEAGEELTETLQAMSDEFETWREHGPFAAALGARAFEQTLRVAGVVALGEALSAGDERRPFLSRGALEWAFRCVKVCLTEMVVQSNDYVADNPFERLMNSIMRKAQEECSKSKTGDVRQYDLLRAVTGGSRNYQDVKGAMMLLVEQERLRPVMTRDDQGNLVVARPKSYRI